jgi:hypothetical protein
MSVNLDRFAQGIHDPQEINPKILGRCKHCNELIHEAYEHVIYDRDYFCDVYCFANYMGAEEVY